MEAPLVATTAEASSSPQSAEQKLGGLVDHPPCTHCLMGPCITVGELTHMQGSCAPDITNHTKRHKDYRRFWKSLKDRGLWQHECYINRKTAAGLSESCANLCPSVSLMTPGNNTLTHLVCHIWGTKGHKHSKPF